ncbi:IspD/TarI family cytidylyltransferase [Pseudonocardia humida]|uniref:2-C-methyl-D-erythritol 4-phosphate cytidylyltransferase n=1 Tax=Pseudonocardia humida TaxID=2800819 RepID=A0ABT1AD91_9PSEU|nr:IspD/TarI family cytidylyltransferase [Pseudonocardia humida]MCO1660968.1 2-C-methyl-D-erythritol 4-phosphate cytidylyltransferase [Pseudonocardia humida]
MQHGRGRAAAIVLAGGSGSRFGAAVNKVYLPLAGRPVIAWSLAVMAAHPQVGPVVLVAREDDLAAATDAVRTVAGTGRIEVTTGGASRQESELAGLRRLAERIADRRVDVVLVHDGARPLLSADLVDRVLAAARETGGAVPGLARHDLVAAGPDGALTGPAPEGLVAVQTPQGFRAAPLLAAYEAAARAGFAGTDTESCMARFAPDVRVRRVDGEGRNIKITYGHDLEVATAVLAGTRPAAG